MRNQFGKTIADVMGKDKRVVTLLGDVSVANFADAFIEFPERMLDVGILEQATIGMCAGLSITGMIPIFHTITPFLVERAFEQLKVDFGYQNLNGNFIGQGGSFDYSLFGPTHNCPADVPVLKMIPNMQILVPGTAKEFDMLFRANYNNGAPTFYRIGRDANKVENNVQIGKATVIKKGSKATVVAVGPMLETVLRNIGDEDITILYYTSVAPFDRETLSENIVNSRIMICEPYYKGALSFDVLETTAGTNVKIEQFGYAHIFLQNYGYTVQSEDELECSDTQFINQFERLMK